MERIGPGRVIPVFHKRHRNDTNGGGAPGMLRPAMRHDLDPAAAVSPGALRRFSVYVDLLVRERTFLIVLSLGFLAAGMTYDTPWVAAWLGFLFAGYSAVANDSIQTIGTFITSNRQRPWWVLWLFIGGLFVATMTYGWLAYDGDVSYQRLASKGFERAPTSFSFLQVAAPLFLMVLTRLRMPVSTTFLLLSSFATTPDGVGRMLVKSVSGYVIAFLVAVIVWVWCSRMLERWMRSDSAGPGWHVAQWITSGALWIVWLMQDAANIAVYLPRRLGVIEFLVFVGVIFVGLGLLFWMGGERIQEVVDEKSDVVDVRSATIIDLVYALILYVFQFMSTVPMSTTWVFLGLLGGRELAMALRGSSDRTWREALGLLGRDVLYASIGLVLSVVIALSVNEPFGRLLFG